MALPPRPPQEFLDQKSSEGLDWDEENRGFVRRKPPRPPQEFLDEKRREGLIYDAPRNGFIRADPAATNQLRSEMFQRLGKDENEATDEDNSKVDAIAVSRASRRMPTPTEDDGNFPQALMAMALAPSVEQGAFDYELNPEKYSGPEFAQTPENIANAKKLTQAKISAVLAEGSGLDPKVVEFRSPSYQDATAQYLEDMRVQFGGKIPSDLDPESSVFNKTKFDAGVKKKYDKIASFPIPAKRYDNTSIEDGSSWLEVVTQTILNPAAQRQSAKNTEQYLEAVKQGSYEPLELSDTSINESSVFVTQLMGDERGGAAQKTQMSSLSKANQYGNLLQALNSEEKLNGSGVDYLNHLEVASEKNTNPQLDKFIEKNMVKRVNKDGVEEVFSKFDDPDKGFWDLATDHPGLLAQNIAKDVVASVGMPVALANYLLWRSATSANKVNDGDEGVLNFNIASQLFSDIGDDAATFGPAMFEYIKEEAGTGSRYFFNYPLDALAVGALAAGVSRLGLRGGVRTVTKGSVKNVPAIKLGADALQDAAKKSGGKMSRSDAVLTAIRGEGKGNYGKHAIPAYDEAGINKVMTAQRTLDRLDKADGIIRAVSSPTVAVAAGLGSARDYFQKAARRGSLTIPFTEKVFTKLSAKSVSRMFTAVHSTMSPSELMRMTIVKDGVAVSAYDEILRKDGRIAMEIQEGVRLEEDIAANNRKGTVELSEATMKKMKNILFGELDTDVQFWIAVPDSATGNVAAKAANLSRAGKMSVEDANILKASSGSLKKALADLESAVDSSPKRAATKADIDASPELGLNIGDQIIDESRGKDLLSNYNSAKKAFDDASAEYNGVFNEVFERSSAKKPKPKPRAASPDTDADATAAYDTIVDDTVVEGATKTVSAKARTAGVKRSTNYFKDDLRRLQVDIEMPDGRKRRVETDAFGLSSSERDRFKYHRITKRHEEEAIARAGRSSKATFDELVGRHAEGAPIGFVSAEIISRASTLKAFEEALRIKGLSFNELPGGKLARDGKAINYGAMTGAEKDLLRWVGQTFDAPTLKDSVGVFAVELPSGEMAHVQQLDRAATDAAKIKNKLINSGQVHLHGKAKRVLPPLLHP